MSVTMIYNGLEHHCVAEYINERNVPEVYWKDKGHYIYEKHIPEAKIVTKQITWNIKAGSYGPYGKSVEYKPVFPSMSELLKLLPDEAIGITEAYSFKWEYDPTSCVVEYRNATTEEVLVGGVKKTIYTEAEIWLKDHSWGISGDGTKASCYVRYVALL